MKMTRYIYMITFIFLFSCTAKKEEYSKIQGHVFGTTFLIKYKDVEQRDFEKEILALFKGFNNSLSTYHPNSTISKLNNGLESIEVDFNFKEVFKISQNVYQQTDGYFDPTIGKMVNAWGFGPQKNIEKPTAHHVDSLMQFVGLQKVKLKNNNLIKSNKETVLDFNAIAKGYGVDVVGLFLEEKGVKDYLVEIGGEIRVRGKNKTDNYWSIGIEEPNFDGTRSLQKIMALENKSMATSGNYRKYKVDTITGKKYAHTLNPKTGFPAKTDMLSASVIGSTTCAEVDAFATAFMAMGFQKAKKLALEKTDLEVYFIYADGENILTFSH